jgi:threonine dehydrogenase-like Zn-dependent dehydrogenase
MLPKTSFAMVQTAPLQLEGRDIKIPEIDDDSAILELEACGICGSDAEQYHGVIKVPMPIIPGHEPLGRIAKIGDKAAQRWGVDVGDRVAVETMISCRFCSCCLGGRYHLCEQRQMYSYIPLSESPSLWGGYSQYMFLHPNTIMHKVSPELPPELAVIFNPLGAGYRWGVEIPQTKPGDKVVILGPGQRGLCCVIACKEVGASMIIVTGLTADTNKLKVAQYYGADHTIDVEQENSIKRVKELTNGGADIVIDVSAYATQPVRDALHMVKPGGTIVLAGVKGMKPVDDFVSDLIVLKEISIRGAIGVTSTGYKNAISLIESGRIDFQKMHTHEFDLADAALAIRTLGREEDGEGSIHSCLIPPS